jgi:hypothetical protein
MSKFRESGDPTKKALRQQAIEAERLAYSAAIQAILKANGLDHRSDYPCAVRYDDGRLYVAVPGSMLSASYRVAHISVDPDEPPRTWGILEIAADHIA